MQFANTLSHQIKTEWETNASEPNTDLKASSLDLKLDLDIFISDTDVDLDFNIFKVTYSKTIVVTMSLRNMHWLQTFDGNFGLEFNGFLRWYSQVFF